MPKVINHLSRDTKNTSLEKSPLLFNSFQTPAPTAPESLESVKPQHVLLEETERIQTEKYNGIHHILPLSFLCFHKILQSDANILKQHQIYFHSLSKNKQIQFFQECVTKSTFDNTAMQVLDRLISPHNHLYSSNNNNNEAMEQTFRIAAVLEFSQSPITDDGVKLLSSISTLIVLKLTNCRNITNNSIRFLNR
jgi:hypothetical protein